MKNIKIKGTAIFSRHGVRFESGIPSNQSVFEKAWDRLGKLHVSCNACASFQERNVVSLPPVIHQVSDGTDYSIKRSSRNYLIQFKVPIVEDWQQSESHLQELLDKVQQVIAQDRQATLGPVLKNTHPTIRFTQISANV